MERGRLQMNDPQTETISHSLRVAENPRCGQVLANLKPLPKPPNLVTNVDVQQYNSTNRPCRKAVKKVNSKRVAEPIKLQLIHPRCLNESGESKSSDKEPKPGRCIYDVEEKVPWANSTRKRQIDEKGPSRSFI